MGQIKFDSSKRYVSNSNNKKFGKGVWYRDINNDGKYDLGDLLIQLSNRIRNFDNSYVQLNSDGTVTILSDSKGNTTKEVENKLSDADKYAMKHKLVWGRAASYNNKTKKWERNNNNQIQWDLDTERKDNNTDIYGNTLSDLEKFVNKKSQPLVKAALVQSPNSNSNLNTNENLSESSNTFWDLNPNGGSYMRGNSKLTYNQIDDGEGLNGSGYNDVDDAYREAWLAVNPQAKANRAFWKEHNIFKKDRNLDIRKEYVSQYENDLNDWLNKYYAINPAQNKSVFNPDHKYLRISFTQKDTNNNDVPYVPLFTGNLWGFGVGEYMDANGNTTYLDYNGNAIPGLVMKNGKPYIPASTPGKYFKTGGKLIKRQNNGILRKFN